MANRLLSMGFPVSVYNRSREKATKLADAGAFVSDTPREAAGRSEMVIAMVADDAASRDIWLGDDGALAGAVSGSLLLESSTLSVGWVKELNRAAAEKHCEFLDAPVTGTKPHATNGELFFMVGGSSLGFSRAREVLSALGRVGKRSLASWPHRKRRTDQTDQQLRLRSRSRFRGSHGFS
jgi:3-hydroxyisobutyrate dehydrogenase-like beta-hydroxyacid dehydrogenase